MKLANTLLILAFSSFVFGQSYWSSIPKNQKNLNTESLPADYTLYELKLASISKLLVSAPDLAKKNKSKGVQIEMPVYGHGMVKFEMFEASIMAPKLQAKLSHLRSYKGFSADGKFQTRITNTSRGITASILSEGSFFQIDPLTTKTYASYNLDSFDGTVPTNHLTCGTKNPEDEFLDHSGHDHSHDQNVISQYKSGPLANETVEMREYGLALACTGEFGARWGDTKEQVFEILMTSLSQMNLIYENDLAIRMVFIEEQLEVIHLDPETDPYTQAVSGGQLLGVNTGVINNIVGFNRYDVGHIYTNGCNDTGGIAALSSTCTGRKGAGVTCISGNNIAFQTLRIAAHEFGHQMGANHTFNNCSGNENFGTAYEPGSGSTIMSYSGICGQQNNVQNGPYANYHNISLNEIFNHTRLGDGANCGETFDSGNTNPNAVIDIADDFYIPSKTPFVLDASATDAEGDVLTYNWEQFNLGPQSELGTPLNNAPSFKAGEPDSESIRYFPDLPDIINNVQRKTEVLPEVDRELTFRFTTRDNNINAGGVDYDQIDFKCTAAAGPFQVGFPSLAEILEAGQEIELTWDVANTDVAPVNCQNVEILFSSNGGFDFDKIIAVSTPNDGSHKVIIPNAITNRARFMIKAKDNIFFDISNFNSTIVEPSEPGYYMETTFLPDPICLPETVNVDITTAGFQGYSDEITFEVDGLPEGASANFSPNAVAPGVSSQMSIDLSNVSESGFFDVVIKSNSGTDNIIERTVTIETIYNGYEDLAIETPVDGQSGVNGLPTFNWTNAEAAESYSFELATNPSFDEESIVLIENNLTETTYTPSALLENNEIYYWRVNGKNRCSNGDFIATSAFHTVSLNCQTNSSLDLPVNISASGTRTVEARIDVTNAGAIKDVNVKKVKGNHEQVSDLKMTLISPAGTAVVLFDRECGNLANFDCGFDDEAPNSLNCPVTGGITFVPESPLSAFIDEDGSGTWILRIEDMSPGFGGVFNEFTLELCADQLVNDPFIVNNLVLEAPTGGRDRISNDLLLCEDTDNSAGELLYTLVSNTSNGTLSLNEVDLAIGDQFTQIDINSNGFRYQHDDTDTVSDNFKFVVEDPNGGWISITQFDISLDDDFVSSLAEITDIVGLAIYPNPANKELVVSSDSNEVINLEILDLTGRRLWNDQSFGGETQRINVSNFPNGIYFVKVGLGEKSGTQKIVIQH